MNINYSEELAKELATEVLNGWCYAMQTGGKTLLAAACIDIARDSINDIECSDISDDEILMVINSDRPGGYVKQWKFAPKIWLAVNPYLQGRADEYVESHWWELTDGISTGIGESQNLIRLLESSEPE